MPAGERAMFVGRACWTPPGRLQQGNQCRPGHPRPRAGHAGWCYRPGPSRTRRPVPGGPAQPRYPAAGDQEEAARGGQGEPHHADCGLQRQPVIAGTILGDAGDISRFTSWDHFAACNGTPGSGGLEPADLLHPPDVQLHMRTACGQRVQAVSGAPGQVAAQARFGVVAGGAFKSGRPGGCGAPVIQPQQCRCWSRPAAPVL